MYFVRVVNCSKIIEKVRNSIALVVALDTNNKPIGTASGFIYQQKGILITCNHVVKDAGSIVIKFSDSSSYIITKVVLRDEEHDLALLKCEDNTHEPLQPGDFAKVIEGVEVIFSGYPLSSSDLTTHQGIISNITKDQTSLTSYLIDGTVNAGNSGCPLMDSDGKVIGVVDATRRVRGEILDKIERMSVGATSLHGVDVVEIYQSLIKNLQLGVGHAVPASYIPEYKEIKPIKAKAVKKLQK